MRNNESEESASRKIQVCNNVIRLCKEREVCEGVLSLLSGLSEEYVHKIFCHAILPSRKALQSISIAIGVHVDDFTKDTQ